MKFWLWAFFLLVGGTLSGSTIPQYQITAIEGEQVTFSNGAVFTVLFNKWILQEWHINDFVKLASPNVETLQYGKTLLINGELVVFPFLLMENQSNPAYTVTLLLETPPNYPAPATYLVASIDSVNRQIVLSNASQWEYSNTDDFRAETWEINDLIMVGNNNAVPYSQYDAILFNATKQNVIKTVQQ